MKIRKPIMILVMLFSLLHFSPHIAEAAEEDTTKNTDTTAKETSNTDGPSDTDTTETTDAAQNTKTAETTNSTQDTNKQSETKTTEQPSDTDQNKTEQKSLEENTNELSEEQQQSTSTAQENEDQNNLTIQSESVEEPDTLPFEKGEKAPAIAAFKEKLNAIGFGDIWVTDYFGSFTEEQVRKFQEYYGLTVTGVVNQTTLDKINSIYNSPFQKGHHHEGISDMKKKLNRIGFGGILVTDYFGGFTEDRVREFQSAKGLVVNGIADEVTRARLDQAFANAYRVGASHEGIIEIKQKLNRLGFDGIWVTTYYGNFTKQRVSEFQKYYGLKATGIANMQTLEKMDAILASPYQKGKRHEKISELKKNLSRLGFGGILVTDYFGNFTENQVRSFQSYYGLIENGIADDPTLGRLNEVLSSPYQKGKSHEDISELKKKLNRIGFGDILVTDYYGNFTATRVRDFQEYYGLRVNGIIDDPTKEKLNQVFSNGFQAGAKHEGIKELKLKLNALGFGDILVTNYFGSFTEKKVKDFQKYYGLEVTGKVDTAMFNKIEQVLVSPYQKGKSQQENVELKRKLKWLGYGGTLMTTYFGNGMEEAVKAFQKDYNLAVSGIAEEITRTKLDQTIKDVFQKGSSDESIKKLKKGLNRLGFDGILVTDYYGGFTEQQVSKFQEYYGLNVTGAANLSTLKKLDELLDSPYQTGSTHKGIAVMKEKLNRLSFGELTENNNYDAQVEKQVSNFQSYFDLVVNGIADEPTRNKIDEVYNSPFQKGKNHQDTIALKEDLNRLGFGDIMVTTYFGNYTDQKVRDFQSHYGLRVNGIVSDRTFTKINEILASPFQAGKRHDETDNLKIMLKKLGYDGIQVTEYFGDFTEKRLKEFQADYNLPVSGIADEITWKKLEEAVASREIFTYTQYDVTLDQAVDIQMGIKNPPPQTDLYRNDPAYVHGDYIEIEQSAVISGSGVNVRTKPLFGDYVKYTLNDGTRITIEGEVQGDSFAGSTKWYKIGYNNETLYVHSSLVNINGTIAKTTAKLNVRAAASASSHIYGTLSEGETVSIINKEGSWYQITYKTWRNATRKDTKSYVNTGNNDVFQHLDLSYNTGSSDSELNQFLVGAGILEGKGQAFIDGARKYSVNELYLISHAKLETGYGTSALATGSIKVGKNNNGEPVVATLNNRDLLTDIKSTYNMFGVHAYDSCPNTCGAKFAYEQGWFTPSAAIVGGAKFIGQKYIHNEYNQNTLYKMRWNPAAMEGGGFAHQYATDIGWATKQISNFKNMYEILSDPFYKYDIAQYK